MDARGLSARPLLLALAFAAGGCGDDPAYTTGQARQAVNGSDDPAGQFAMVVGVVSKKGQYLSRCSGALVARNLVLTARHCVAPSSGGIVTCGQAPLGAAIPPADVLVTSKPVQSDVPEDYVAVARIEVAPGGDDTCGFDLAAVVLEGAGLGESAPTTTPRIDEPPHPLEQFTAVGYGSTGSGGVGTRRFKTGVGVNCVGSGCVALPAADSEWISEDDAFCQSDSGSAALDASGRLIGIVSRGVSPCTTPVLASPAAFEPWLLALGAAAAAEGGYAPAGWVVTGRSVPLLDAGAHDAAGGDDAGGSPPPSGAPAADDSAGCSQSPPGPESPSFGLVAGVLSLALARRRRGQRS
jgi:MYXO-CTERM domain-containing protein